MRLKLPFGIAQIGKSFRNEITPGNFTFRTREFEQMEIEFFVMPGTDEEWHQRWLDERFAWYPSYGIRKENLRLREHDKDELAHYAKRTADIEYLFPMGWSELEGIANRTDFDLKQHAQFSGKTLRILRRGEQTKNCSLRHRAVGRRRPRHLAFLVDAYSEEEVKGEKRVVLKFHPELAPIKIAVLPLLKKNPRSSRPRISCAPICASVGIRFTTTRRPIGQPLSPPGRSRYALLRHRRRPDRRR